jgi:hypothetical protein
VAKILEFPTQAAQGFSYLERRLEEMLAAKGADEELVGFATRTVREIYETSVEEENYTVSLALPEGISAAAADQLQADIQTAIESLRRENHALVVRLVAELALAHLKLFQYERNAGS